jgi:NAD(P)H dehydrogenase (quinone)
MSSKIALILGNPKKESLSRSLMLKYKEGAEAGGAHVDILDLAALNFDPVLRNGYGTAMEDEPDLIYAKSVIQIADHLVFVYPNWWSTVPAILKGFIDRVFVPGFAFNYRKNSPLPEQLLKGKSARLIVTMDSPGFFYSLFLGRPGDRMMRQGVLNFCGVKSVSMLRFPLVRSTAGKKVPIWLKQVYSAGVKDAGKR